jgi:ribosomal-protein-serine acetyltransferase
VLTDGRIEMRPLQPTDADAVYAAVTESIPEISRWLPWCTPGYARANTVDFIACSGRAWLDGTQFQFGIFAARDGGFLGSLGINHLAWSNRLANIGYWVRTSSTRSGTATAAVRLAACHAFRELGLGRLEIACMPENLPSRRVAEKVGAKFETMARNRIVMHGRPYDAALYSLAPGDLDT